ASSSATSAAPTPARSAHATAPSPWPTAGPSSSTRLASYSSRSRPSSSAWYRSARTSASAATPMRRATSSGRRRGWGAPIARCRCGAPPTAGSSTSPPDLVEEDDGGSDGALEHVEREPLVGTVHLIAGQPEAHQHRHDPQDLVDSARRGDRAAGSHQRRLG